MLEFNEKFICIYDRTTSRHYITQTQLYPDSNLLTTSSISHEDKQKKPKDQLNIFIQGGKQQKNEENQMGVVDFKNIFARVGLHLPEGSKKQIYLAQLNRYCEFSQLSSFQYCVPEECLEAAIILIRVTHPQQLSRQETINIKGTIFAHPNYNQNEYESSHKNQYDSSQREKKDKQEIKQRDRLRTIGDIIYYVKKWRKLADQGLNGMRLNLQEAAVYVGIPKKSLDDYYYQLRAGQKYDFDFEANSHKNISELRKFVKSKIPSRQRQKKMNACTTNEGEQSESKSRKLPQKLQKLVRVEQNKQENVKSDQNQTQQIKISRLSDGEVSPIHQGWLSSYSSRNNGLIFDDEDSFFNDFKYCHEEYIGFNYLMKNM